MEHRLKERLIGAAVLVMLAVIFIPMILNNAGRNDTAITKTNIPAPPAGEFDSKIVPLRESDVKQPPPAQPRETMTQETPVEQAPPEETESKMAPPATKEEGKEAATPPPAEAKPVTTPVTKPAPPQAAAKPATPTSPAGSAAMRSQDARGLTAWVVQIGSFSSQANADRLVKKLRDAGYPAFVEPVKQGGEQVYRVRVGPELQRSDAQALRDKLMKELKMKGLMVYHYP
jgi:DedD protein